MRAKLPINPKRRARPSLTNWLGQYLAPATSAHVQVRLRGNILHVLCETPHPLVQVSALTRLVAVLLDPTEGEAVTQAYPQVYQLYIYSRQKGSKQPDWAAPIYLNRLERHQAQLQLKTHDSAEIEAVQGLLRTAANHTPVSPAWTKNSTTAALVLSQLSLARRGDPTAISWYLSEVLSALDVGVWVSIRAVSGPVGPAQNTKAQSASLSHDVATPAPEQSRLWVFCEAAYSPDPMLIAEPVTERLRQLELSQFKDAVIVVQVQGESTPDWSLRIDLTPPAEMLAEWGRWGDEQAIVRLLAQELAPQSAQVTVERKDSTLHLVVTSLSAGPIPDETTITAAISTTLERLAPQGLQRAMVYGQPEAALTPTWVKCLNLPALEHENLATAPSALAQQRDWPALQFLLTRLLNPDLEVQLATGGLRVQLIERADLLHVMVDGPVCPRRQYVVPTVVKQVKAIAPNRIEGIRIYGRRAAWNYGTDFQTRDRLVPEAEAQFAATDAYVGDLLAHPEEETHAPDLTLGAVGQWLKALGQQSVMGTRQVLLKSQFFVPNQGLPRELPVLPERDRQDALKIGLVWGVIGLLLALQGDWFLGQWLNPPPAVAEAEADTEIAPFPSEQPDDALTAALSDLDWGNGQSLDDAEASGQLAGDTFTDEAEWPLQGEASREVITPALLETSPYPSFRSQQMDHKLALYHQRLQLSGPPDVLIIGSSRALRGVDPAALRQELATLGYGDLDIFNFGVNGSTAQVVDLTLRRILTEDQLPRLVIWADGARAFNSGRGDITYNGIMASEGYRQLGRRTQSPPENTASDTTDAISDASAIADDNLDDASEALGAALRNSYQTLDQQLSDRLGIWSAVYSDREGLKTKVQEVLLQPFSNALLFWKYPLVDPDDLQLNTSDRPLPDNSRIDFDGFLAMDVRFNPATYYQLYARVAGDYDSDYRDFELRGQQAVALQQLVQFTQERNLPLIFVNTPLTDEYLDSYRMAAETDFLKFMVEFSATAPDFIFRDLGQIWPQRYDYFSDPSHLNRYGAYQVSSRIAQDPMIPWPHKLPEPERELTELAP